MANQTLGPHAGCVHERARSSEQHQHAGSDSHQGAACAAAWCGCANTTSGAAHCQAATAAATATAAKGRLTGLDCSADMDCTVLCTPYDVRRMCTEVYRCSVQSAACSLSAMRPTTHMHTDGYQFGVLRSCRLHPQASQELGAAATRRLQQPPRRGLCSSAGWPDRQGEPRSPGSNRRHRCQR